MHAMRVKIAAAPSLQACCLLGALLAVAAAHACAEPGSCSAEAEPLLEHAPIDDDDEALQLLQRRSTKSVDGDAHNLTVASAHNLTAESTHNGTAKAANASRLSLMEQLSQELSYELELESAPMTRDKLALAFINILGLGMIGVDRCYMGQTLLGFIKAFTLGGFWIWALLDYAAIVITCLSQYESINALGYRAHFTGDSVHPAFWVTLVGLMLKFVLGCCRGYSGRAAITQQQQLQEQQVKEAADSPSAAAPAN